MWSRGRTLYDTLVCLRGSSGIIHPMASRGAQGLDKRRGAQILASRSDEGGDGGETHLVASGDVEGAPRTCAGHDRSPGHDAEGIAAGVEHLKPDAHRHAGMFQGDLDFLGASLARRPFLRSGEVIGERCSKLVIDLLNSVCQILVFSVWRSGWVSCPFPSKRALRAHRLWSCSLGGGQRLGGAPLAVVRSSECLWCR